MFAHRICDAKLNDTKSPKLSASGMSAKVDAFPTLKRLAALNDSDEEEIAPPSAKIAKPSPAKQNVKAPVQIKESNSEEGNDDSDEEEEEEVAAPPKQTPAKGN